MTSIRREFRTLTQTQWQQYVNAVAKVKAHSSPGNYDGFTQIFNATATTVLGHAVYLPFLRQFLLAFEQALQGFDPTVTLPYWNTALDAQAPEQSPVFTTGYAGGNGTGPGGAVASAGAFGAWTVATPFRTSW